MKLNPQLCRRASSLRGFTLIELMIVVLVIAILAGIAFASYQQYVIRSNRSKAIAAVNKVAYEEERFLYSYGQYTANLTAPHGANAASSGLGLSNTTCDAKSSDSACYAIAVNQNACTDNLCYAITATPQGAVQSKDSCGTLTLTSSGERSASHSGCW
ncbi:MAG TPA: type IV pilin protein [Burkholderiales bacterium]|nr:type IV pilin protein [Burkholderiales bacterium]